MEEEEEEGESGGGSSLSRPFSLATYAPSDPGAATHRTRLGGLEGGRRYEVKIGAATSVGVGPNSTLATGRTLERTLSSGNGVKCL